METKENAVFRQKSIDRVTSPEQMNDYLRVTNPAVWMLLAAVILLLVGSCVWGIFGRLDTVLSLAVRAQDGTLTCYVSSDAIDSVEVGMTVTIGGEEYEVLEISESVVLAEELDASVRAIGEMESSTLVYDVVLDGFLDDGVYEATLVTESISPASFLLN